jgi:Endoplasmic reticulum vesicle transporter/Endoplasmic Reticulum-Golgi Intermediate Compartment (ERGIC)
MVTINLVTVETQNPLASFAILVSGTHISTMVALRRLDAFTKTRSDLKQQSAVGGAITLVAASAAGVLFVSQLILYIMGSTTHSLTLSRSTPVPMVPLEESALYDKYKFMASVGRLPLKLKITFPHLSCDSLDVIHDGASLASGELDRIHGPHSLTLRKPTYSEMTKAAGLAMASQARTEAGCTIVGTLQPHIVAGVFIISMSRQAWSVATTTLSMGLFDPSNPMKQALHRFNVSHYIHYMEFGKPFSKQKNKPLEDVLHAIDNEFYGIAVVQTQVKLVPTLHQGFLFKDRVYQTSVVDITIQPQTLVSQGVQQLPGLVVTYDFTPLTVNHSEGRENVLVFLSSLISIVGGVFVTVGLLTGCLVHSAQAVAKKID